MLWLLLTAVCILLATYIVPSRNRYHAQHRALSALGDKVRHVAKAKAQPKWLSHFVDEEAYYDVVHLSFQGMAALVRGGRSGFNDQHMAHLSKFPKLRRLSLHSTDATELGMHHLARLYRLETLSLEMTSTGKGLSHLSRLRNLRDLNLSHCNSRGQLKHLANLRNLESLQCGSANDEDLAYIASLPKLKHLTLLSVGITERGLSAFRGHPTLERLSITVSNESVEIVDCPNLEFLYVSCYSHDYPPLHLRNLPKLKTLDDRHVRLVEVDNVPLLQGRNPP